jgi:hypothetical protein
MQKTDALRLEQYKEKCPVHGVVFEGERFCKEKECGYRWPPQNYVAAPNTLWWDGFRQPDGTVRQFFFTADTLRDVGIAVLGKDRVPAFGFAIFRAKEPRPRPTHRPARAAGLIGASADSAPYDTLLAAFIDGPDGPELLGQSLEKGGGAASPRVRRMGSAAVASAASVSATRREAITKTVAVGRGAQIHQDLVPDPKRLDEWEAEPSAVIAIYFVPEDVAVQILEGPRRDLIGHPEGALAHVNVPAGTD